MVLDFRPVTDRPVKDQQQIPDGDFNMAVSWSVELALMRLRIPVLHDQKRIKWTGEGEPWVWEFKSCAGRTVATGCDNDSGRMLLRASAEIDEADPEFIRFWRPDDAVPHLMVPGPALFSPVDPHIRQCRLVPTKQWRARDENRDNPTFGDTILGSGYVGDHVLEWLERGSHIFHDGIMKQPEPLGLFHLYDPLIDYE